MCTSLDNTSFFAKRQLHKKYPHLLNLPGGLDAVKEAFADALVGIWNGDGVTVGEPLYLYAAVIKAQAGIRFPVNVLHPDLTLHSLNQNPKAHT